MKRRREEQIDLQHMRAMIGRGKKALKPACLPIDNSVVRGLVTNMKMIFDALEHKMFISKAGRDERVACARELVPELPDAVTDVYYDRTTDSAVVSTEASFEGMRPVWHADNADVMKRCTERVKAEGRRVDSVFHAPASVVDDGYYRCLFNIK